MCDDIVTGQDEENVNSDKEPEAGENLILRIQTVIKEAKFVGVVIEKCEVPSALLISRDIVANLKDSLLNHPDKTQCVIGVIKIVDENNSMNGKHQVWVNAELFVAIQELSFEGIDFYGGDRIPTVVHTLTENEALNAETLGIFLNKNSKEFSEQ